MDKKKGTILTAFLLSIFLFFFANQETNITNKLNECSRFTYFYPLNYRGNNFDGYYLFNHKKVFTSVGLAADDVGEISKKTILKQFFLIQISCENPKINRVRAEYEILNYSLIPPTNGWGHIPKELKLRDGGWLYNNVFRGRYFDWY